MGHAYMANQKAGLSSFFSLVKPKLQTGFDILETDMGTMTWNCAFHYYVPHYHPTPSVWPQGDWDVNKQISL